MSRDKAEHIFGTIGLARTTGESANRRTCRDVQALQCFPRHDTINSKWYCVSKARVLTALFLIGFIGEIEVELKEGRSDIG